VKSNNPWLNYSDLNIETLGVVGHLKFDRKWTLTIPGDPQYTSMSNFNIISQREFI